MTVRLNRWQGNLLVNGFLENGATFSPCRLYRYSLHRQWYDGKPYCCFIGLNPSTADETHDDPTVRRCIDYARTWDFGGLIMLNLFAFRATNPDTMKVQADPIGPDNDRNIRNFCRQSRLVIAAWGNDGAYRRRGEHVYKMLNSDGIDLHYLRLTQSKQPGHPLYLPRTLQPIKWEIDKALLEAAGGER